MELLKTVHLVHEKAHFGVCGHDRRGFEHTFDCFAPVFLIGVGPLVIAQLWAASAIFFTLLVVISAVRVAQKTQPAQPVPKLVYHMQ
mmetsp:Transcript_31834/g.39572  ORF Transcript_31834/g.39572 Transcript_31834/m.39572 type:complete len:87 (+) Transcript_31834:586-846(+)